MLPRHRIPEQSKTDGHDLPSATVRKSKVSWMLWLVPVGAAALCVWFVFRDYVATGPLITLYFQDVEGLQAQNTLVQYRGASIGQVKSISLTPDGTHVKVQARLAEEAGNLARVGSVFWIVRPELRVGAISGLRTIVSGEYITVQPGNGPPTNSFVGAEKSPLPEEPNALQIVLYTPTLGSLQEQSPIFYRGVQVGEVAFYQLASDARQVIIHARVWQEYAPLVRMNSEFWNAGGLDFSLGLFKGLQLSAESPRTIVSGGIEFATPPDLSGLATNGATFALNEKPEDKWKAWSPEINLQLPAQATFTNAPAVPILK
jgi:paraquat-inducible protein B